nr:ribonuclease H-like domain-containing protein [Tanacetum cinerariifolium]
MVDITKENQKPSSGFVNWLADRPRVDRVNKLVQYGVLDEHQYGVSSLDMDFPPRDQRHLYLRYEGLQYTDADIVDFETRLAKIYRRKVHRVQDKFCLQAELGGVYLRLEAHWCMSSFWSSLALLDSERVYLIWIRLEHYSFSWVELEGGPKRQQVAAAGNPEATEDAPVADEGALAIPAPVQTGPYLDTFYRHDFPEGRGLASSPHNSLWLSQGICSPLVRSTRDELPDVRSAYAIISSDESHRVVSSSGVGTSQRSQSFVFNSNVGNRNNAQSP